MPNADKAVKDPQVQEERSIFERFWSGKGNEYVEIVNLMSQKETWTLDGDLGRRLDVFAESLSAGNGLPLSELTDQHDFIQLQAWLTSEKALMFASLLDEANPTLIIEILEMAGKQAGVGEPLQLFVERLVTFSRARLISDILNVDRVRRIEKLAKSVKK